MNAESEYVLSVCGVDTIEEAASSLSPSDPALLTAIPALAAAHTETANTAAHGSYWTAGS